MRKFGLSVLILLAACILWFGFNLLTLPAPPSICATLSDEVVLNFTIDKMNISEIEITSTDGGQPVFIHFSRTNDWAKGKPGLAVTTMARKSTLGNGVAPDQFNRDNPGNKDFGQFMKDSKGNDVRTYTFRHQIAEGDDGRTYMKMSYDGPKVPLIQLLRFPEDIQVPDHLVQQFEAGGKITFLKGTYHLDRKMNGFWIPVRIEA